MPDPFSGIQDKDLANFCRDLVRRGYEVRHMGTDHFQAFWEGEYTHCRIPLTPKSGQALTNAKADIRRFERSHGMLAEPVKSSRPKKPKAKARRDRRVFVMPEAWDATSDRRPASIAPSQYTVATMLGADAMMKLAAVVNPQAPKPVVSTARQAEEVKMKQRKEWTQEEMAAILFRYRKATQNWLDWRASGYVGDKPQTGVALLKELGLGSSHISHFTKKLGESGNYPELDTTKAPEVVKAEEVYPPQVVVSEPEFDPDEEITELTRQWSELVTRKRELAGTSAGLQARIDDMLVKAEELSVQRDNVTAEAADVAASITKVRKRLAEVAGNE